MYLPSSRLHWKPLRQFSRDRVVIAVTSLSADLKNMDLNFRAEFFNLFNHSQFGLPVTPRTGYADINAGNFGVMIAGVFRNRTLVVFD